MAKGKMKKIMMVVLVGLLVLILAVALLFKLYGNQLMRTGIIAGTQKALQVAVRLEDVDVEVMAGQVDLNQLEIDNPEGYNHPTFLKMGHAYMELNMATLMSDTIEINMLKLEDITMVIEQKGMSNNLKEILANLPKTEPGPEPVDQAGGKDLNIKVVEMSNIEVQAKLLPIPGRADTVTIHIDPIRLENVGTAEKMNTAELTAILMKAIAGGIATQGKDLLPTDMIGSISGQIGEQGKKLFDAGQGATQGVLEGAQDVGEGATDAIKGIGDIFKKKDE
jgi:hypothetical protein